MVPLWSVSAACIKAKISSPFFISLRPILNSSRVKDPSPFLSNVLKISLSYLISLGLACTAIAVKAAYLSF